MLVILDLNGWQKELDISDSVAYGGLIREAFCTPLPTVYSLQKDKAVAEIIVVDFVYKGKCINDVPVFEAGNRVKI